MKKYDLKSLTRCKAKRKAGHSGPLFWLYEPGIGWLKEEGLAELRTLSNTLDHMEAGRVTKAFGPIYIRLPK